MAKKLFALEKISEAEEVVIAPESEDEFESAAGEVEELQDQTDHAAEVAGTLTAVGDSLGQMEPDAPIPEPVMESLNLAISGLLGSIGMSQRQRSTAMESFSKATTAQMAMESIKDTAIKIWEKIKAFFKKIKEAVIAFYDKLFNVSRRMKLTGNKMIAIGNKMPKEVEGKKFKVHNNDLAALGLSGNVATSDIVKALRESINRIGIVLASIGKVKFSKAEIPSVDYTSDESIASANTKLVDFFEKSMGELAHIPGSTRSEGKVPNGTVIIKTFGDWIIVPKMNEERAVTVSFREAAAETDKDTGDLEVDVVNQTQFVDVGHAYVSLSAKLESAVKSSKDEYVSITNALLDSAEKSGGGENVNGSEVFKLSRALQAAANLNFDLTKAVCALGDKLLRTTERVVNQSAYAAA